MSALWSRPTSSARSIRGITSASQKTSRSHGPEIHRRLESGVAGMGSPSLRIARVVLYLGWTLGLMPVQGVGLALRRPWSRTLPAFYHRWCCRILGLRVRAVGAPTQARPALFASNHVSYADIAVLGSLIVGSFIAKAEVAGWPLFGWLAKLQRTVFVDRRMRSTRLQR